jgi:RNA polymerase sigma factor (sigma-70 family)
MSEDAELLRRYATENSETAFAELIRRHVDLVYSAALRLMNGNAHLAQDVTQLVFAECARQATRLMRHPAPVGWLYTTTRWSALRILRTERRRSAREQEVTTMNELLGEPAPEPDWGHLRPVLEEAMHELGEKDRHAVLLRFFQNKSLKEVGMALELGENAARMRVERALEKLRGALQRRGIAATATLASVISANAVQLAPANLAAALATSSVAVAGTGTLTLIKIMTATQLKLSLGALVIAGAATALVFQHQAQDTLRGENESLRQQLTQLQADNDSLSNRLASAGDSQKLTAGQLSELLKLRGETGFLKNQLAAAKAQAQIAARSLQPAPASDPAEQQRQAQIHKMVNAKYLAAAAMFGFAGHHDDQFPTNWDQTASYFDDWERKGLSPGDPMPDTAADFNEMTNLFDLAYQGAISNLYNATNFNDLIIVREKQPVQTANGNWVKVYGFADGHSQIQSEPPEGFDAYEQAHTVPPPNQ